MQNIRSERVVIIGGGIIGLAHALTAIEAGCKVTIVERNSRPLGASVRNFGTIWPIGLAFGSERNQGLRGVQRWQEISQAAGFHAESCGSLSLAYRDEAWNVLQEFAALPEAALEGFELLSPGETLKRHPLSNPNGLKGALFSPHELCIQPASALTALSAHLASIGVSFLNRACAIKVHDDAVELSDGRILPFDRCVIAAGDEMQILFPAELATAQVRRCQLQMMRTSPLEQRLGAIMVSDLTLAHYPAFQRCPSITALQSVLHDTMADYHQWGVHVIAAQHSDGTLTLGDSHEYGQDFTPDIWSHVEELVLQNLSTFTRLPVCHIESRWHGVYLKSTIGETQVVLHPRDRVTMVTAMGGLGMTLSWGLAEQTISSWTSPSLSPPPPDAHNLLLAEP
ncbi:TIGR03364 family FAD-dependent oxidoreductase [Verrucomicrobium sp. BvORR106]|uniref:TIGR03364 family FAD-dependent oxidoreductase n=1 Tax=Verrucomicrobium sp. BvORR106 TaxID=1403819 RepID=UPI00068ADFE1